MILRRASFLLFSCATESTKNRKVRSAHAGRTPRTARTGRRRLASLQSRACYDHDGHPRCARCRAHTEELLLQTKATDQWAEYQAKDIRRHTYELFVDETSVFTLQNSEQLEKIKDKYAKEIERYKDQMKDIQAEAQKAEAEVHMQQRRANRFDLGEVMLEAGLVLCSITLLTRNRFFWGLGSLLGLVGLVIGAAGLLIHST